MRVALRVIALRSSRHGRDDAELTVEFFCRRAASDAV
jgi:hypothetical protein